MLSSRPAGHNLLTLRVSFWLTRMLSVSLTSLSEATVSFTDSLHFSIAAAMNVRFCRDETD